MGPRCVRALGADAKECPEPCFTGDPLITKHVTEPTESASQGAALSEAMVQGLLKRFRAPFYRQVGTSTGEVDLELVNVDSQVALCVAFRDFNPEQVENWETAGEEEPHWRACENSLTCLAMLRFCPMAS